MREGKRKGRKWPRVSNKVWVLLILLVVLLFMAYALAFKTAGDRTPQLSAYSQDWNDLSDLREDMETGGYAINNVISSPTLLDTLDDPSKYCFVVMGVERAYSNTEAFALYDFFLKGGKLIVADDFGHLDSLSDKGDGYFSLAPTGGQLWDQSFQRNPAFVKITISGGEFFTGTILLNEPSAFKPEGDGHVLARSSPTSWIDLDNDRKHDPGEAYGEQVVARLMESDSYELGVPGGRAVFISDPSMFINDMYHRMDNRNFTRGLMRYIMPAGDPSKPGEGYTVIFDESRHVKESVRSSAGTAFFDGLVRSTTDRNFQILSGAIALLSMIVLLVAAENPRPLRHEHSLGLAKYHHLHSPLLFPGDGERIRIMFLERVRIAYGMGFDEFSQLDDTTVEELIGDPRLADFALKRGPPPGPEELEGLLLEIQRWS